MTRTRDPLTWLAVLVIGFALGLHAAPNPQDVQDRAVETEARADTVEMLRAEGRALLARMDTLTTTCWGVLGEHVEMARIVARWPVGMYGPAREAPSGRVVKAGGETNAASAP